MAGKELERGWTARKVAGTWLTRAGTFCELFQGLWLTSRPPVSFCLFQPLISCHVLAMFQLFSSYLFNSLLNSGVDRPRHWRGGGDYKAYEIL